MKSSPDQGLHEPSRASGTCLDPHLEVFAEALLDPARSVPPGLIGPDGAPSPQRFVVYRNNVIVGLVEALKHAYPAVLRLVGEEFFCATARVFAVRQPPRNPVMLSYGEGFAGFLADFEPVATLPYLPDVARLERAWLEAYHAEEAIAQSPDSLRELTAEGFPGWRLKLHRATRYLRSRYPVATIWQMNIENTASTALIDLGSGGEDVLLTRPDADVLVRTLPPGAFRFIDSLDTGAPLSEATRAALEETPQFDLANALLGLLSAGAVAEWCPPDTEPQVGP
ncbi:MAG: DNA-binding domain-containing protein [Pseudomonas sp.]